MAEEYKASESGVAMNPIRGAQELDEREEQKAPEHIIDIESPESKPPAKPCAAIRALSRRISKQVAVPTQCCYYGVVAKPQP